MTALHAADLWLALCMLVGAALYSSVGHAGASAYIALMALFGLPPAVMRPTALVLNIIVATFASARYVGAGLFRWRTLWPFLVTALPMSFVGGHASSAHDGLPPSLGDRAAALSGEIALAQADKIAHRVE
jgi:uncharacterized membrane protein YfcA